MKTLSSALVTELGLTVTRPGYLVRLDLSTSLSVYFSSIGDVIWDSKTWLAKELRVRLAAADGRGDVRAEVAIGNDSQSMIALILTNGITAKRMRIWTIYKGATASGDPYLAFDGEAGSATMTPSLVTIPASLQQLGWVMCPRKRINKSSGINAMLPNGTKVTIGAQTLTIERTR